MVHKNNDGRSILAQLSKVSGNRGLVTLTFWWNNTITMTDAFGNNKKWPHPTRQSLRAEYKARTEKGWQPVGGKVTVKQA